MNDLIERLEAATKGSRELDATIHASMLGPDWVAEIAPLSGKWVVFCNTKFADKDKKHRVAKAAPEYTTSIDAALTLVPEGSMVDVCLQGKSSYCLVYESNGGSGGFPARAATAALAICVASLKARQA